MHNKIIKIDDIEGKVYELEEWKPSHTQHCKKYFDEKLRDLQSQYENLCHEFTTNKLIYDSQITFKPIIGKNYYLYEDPLGKRFLSLIEPDEWGANNKIKLSFLGTYKQDVNLKWTPVTSKHK